uniref:Uncharacterized protein n=1 Tax=Triticum urartu TaxID=4572 RepID=A0A8R7UP96_TRIUA
MQDTRCHDDLMRWHTHCSLTTSSLPMPISSALVAAGSWTTSSRRLLHRQTCEVCSLVPALHSRHPAVSVPHIVSKYRCEKAFF